jgi:hypothetical protein
MANPKVIFDILRGKNTVKGELDKTAKAALALDKTISAVGGTFGNLKSLFVTGFAIAGIGKAVQISKELQNALIGLTSVARNTGNDVTFVTEAAKDLAKDGLIPLQDVSNSLKNLLAKGFEGEEAIKIFKGLREAAAFNRQGQLELGEAIRGATEGLKNDLSVKVDNAGITKNLSNINKEYATQIGKTVGALTEAEKRQAFLTVGLKEAAVFQGDYNKLLGTFSGATSKASTSFTFLLAELGDFITESPQVIEFLNVLSGGFDKLNKALKGADTTKFGELVDFLLVTPAKFWVEFFTSSIPAKNIKQIDSELEGLNKKLASAEELLKFSSANGKGVKAGFFSGLTGVFAKAQRDVGNLLGQISELKAKKDALTASVTSDDESSGNAGAGGDDIDQTEVTRERKKQEELQKIRDEFALLEQEKRLERQSFVSTLDEERFTKLAEQVGKDSAVKLQAAENLANDEISVAKAKLAKEKAIETQRVKDKQKFSQQIIAIQKKEAQNTVSLIQATGNLSAALAKDGSTAQFLISKAAAIAGSIVSTNLAAAQALATPPGPPFTLPLAAQVKTIGALNTAAIAATTIKGLQNGGILGGDTSSGDQTLFAGNKGETVLNRAQTAELFNIASGRGQKSSEGESKMVQVNLQVGERELASVIRDLNTDGFLS